jgi:H+-translocating NAD(P) transhydrogenase subunit alpha
MTTSLVVIEFTVLILAIFVGFEVISKVPTMLHTPLMSGTNAIHGIVLVGAIVVAGLPHQTTWIRVVALAAVALGTMNVVGGFVVTDRMLGMFKRRAAPVRESGAVEGGAKRLSAQRTSGGGSGEPGGSAAARRGVDEPE